MPSMLSAAESAIVLYCEIMTICVRARPSQLRQLYSDQAARKKSRRRWTGVLDGFVIALFGRIKRLTSWPVQHSLMKALSVNHTLTSITLFCFTTATGIFVL